MRRLCANFLLTGKTIAKSVVITQPPPDIRNIEADALGDLINPTPDAIQALSRALHMRLEIVTPILDASSEDPQKAFTTEKYQAEEPEFTSNVNDDASLL